MTLSMPSAVLALFLSTFPVAAGFKPKASVPGAAEEARASVRAELAHLQSVHIGIRGCSEAATEFGMPDLMPAMSLLDTREALARANFAVREVGIDHQAIWEETRARILEEHAKNGGQYVSPAFCASIHLNFRDDLARLQHLLSRLGSSRDLVGR